MFWNDWGFVLDGRGSLLEAESFWRSGKGLSLVFAAVVFVLNSGSEQGWVQPSVLRPILAGKKI